MQAFVGAYRRLEDKGCRRVPEFTGLVYSSWVSSPWASGIHEVACFGDFCACPGTSPGRAYRTGGHMKMFSGHYNWIFQEMESVANKVEEQPEAMQRSRGEQFGL